MRWALLLALGCVGGGKESGSPPATDDCSDGEIGRDAYEAEWVERFCAWRVGCKMIPGETLDECRNTDFGRPDCDFQSSLYDGAFACGCLELLTEEDCSWGGGTKGGNCFVGGPWWDCPNTAD